MAQTGTMVQRRVANTLAATASYALLLKLCVLLLPDPRPVVSAFGQPGVWRHLAGFHASWFGAVIVAFLLAMVLAGVRGWITQRMQAVGFKWPTLAGGFLAVLLVLIVANGVMGQNLFFIHGIVGWLVVPLLTWAGTVIYDKSDNYLFAQAQKTTKKAQSQLSALHQAITQTE